MNSIGSSRATLDTALYSNVRSRPSSMLFNDSGFVRYGIDGICSFIVHVRSLDAWFVSKSTDFYFLGLNCRFRMGPDHGSNTGAEVGVNHSNQELDRVDERNQPKRMSSKEREGLRASQSFDESVSLFSDS